MRVQKLRKSVNKTYGYVVYYSGSDSCSYVLYAKNLTYYRRELRDLMSSTKIYSKGNTARDNLMRHNFYVHRIRLLWILRDMLVNYTKRIFVYRHIIKI